MNALKTPPFASYKQDTYNLDMAVALLPIVTWAGFMFGARALWLVALGIISCTLIEIAVNLCLYKKLGVDLLGSMITGTLIPLGLPVDIPAWVLIIGSAVAIALAKYPLIIFGRKGSPFSPAAAGILTAVLISGQGSPFLGFFRGGAMPDDSLLNIFIGNTQGAIGTVSVMLIIISGVYLLLRRKAPAMVLVSALTVFCALSIAFYPEWTTYTDNLIYQLLCGGFVFYLVFIACDRNGTPFTGAGRIIYGASFAAIVFALRCHTQFPAPEAASVLIVNLTTPLLDILTKPVPFGGKRKV